MQWAPNRIYVHYFRDLAAFTYESLRLTIGLILMEFPFELLLNSYFLGVQCESICEVGRYGTNCQNKCDCGENGSSCESQSGNYEKLFFVKGEQEKKELNGGGGKKQCCSSGILFEKRL